MASSVAGVIEPKLRQSEIERASRKPTESLDAYDLYLRALALRDKHTDESIEEAIALLKRALGLDPDYAPAKALIGWSRVHQLSHGRTPVAEADRTEAAAFARQALQTGKDDPDTLWMAGFTLLPFAGERAVAASAIDRALVLNPNSAHAWMARGYVSAPEPDKAIEAFEHAIRLSPLDSLRRTFLTGIGRAHLIAGRYDDALDWAEQALREEPDYSGALRVTAVACAHLDRIEEAREAIRHLLQVQPWLTVASLLRMVPPQAQEMHAEGLRKAGLPEK